MNEFYLVDHRWEGDREVGIETQNRVKFRISDVNSFCDENGFTRVYLEQNSSFLITLSYDEFDDLRNQVLCIGGYSPVVNDNNFAWHTPDNYPVSGGF